MFVSISEIDLVEVLGLDRSLSPGEIDQMLDKLSKEIFFRLLTDKLPKLLPKKDFQYLAEKYKASSNLDEIMEEIKNKWPELNIEVHFQKTANEVKKEFMINYLLEFKKDHQDEEIKRNTDLLINELQKEQIDKSLCLDLKEKIIKGIILLQHT